jgi:dienelactone hydrolase
MALTLQACAPMSKGNGSTSGEPVTVTQDVVLQTSVAPQPDEDLATECRYEFNVANRSQRVQGVWVIFERSRDMLRYFQDADVRAFARRHNLALLFPFHCPSKSETGGDINVDPSKGIGRALFTALRHLAQQSDHPEVASARLIVLGFSGTGSLAGRLAGFAPDRVVAVVATAPGHFDPLGMDTIRLSSKAAAIPQLIITGSADAVSGTQRPYDYFRRHFDQGAPWTFVMQNRVPHCCIVNAKHLVLEWLEAVVVKRLTPDTGSYGFIETRPSRDTDCPDQSPPIRSSWCRSTTDAWGGENWSVMAATRTRRLNPPHGMIPAGWLPTDSFANHWVSYVTQPEHPVTLPP